MPQPTREQFDAAAKKVRASAPDGLTKDQFYALIDKELSPKVDGAVSKDEPGTFWGGFMKSVNNQATSLGNSLFESSAHPKEPGDFLSLMLPGAVGAAGEATSADAALRKVIRSTGEGLEKAGVAAKPSSLPLAVTDAMVRGKPSEALTIAGAPYAAQGVGKILQKASRVGEGPSVLSQIDRFGGNVSGFKAGAEAAPVADRLLGNINEMPLHQQMEHLPTEGPMPQGGRLSDTPRRGAPPEVSPIDRFHPNSSGYTPGDIGPDIERILGNINDMPLSQQMKHLPSSGPNPTGRVSTPQPGTENFNDLPLHRQMEHLPETAAPARGSSAPPIQNLGRETAPPTVVRPAGTKAPTLEDALMEALTSGEAEKPALSTAAPEATTAGEGALKQSGKFGKSGSLGQAGGYSSGRPSTQPASIEQALQDELGGRVSDVSPEAVAVPASEPPASASAPHTTSRVQEYISGSQPIDPKDLAPDDWARLRQQFGAKKLSEMTGVPADEIRTKLAPGPSRIPTEAQERIDAFNARQAQQRDR